MTAATSPDDPPSSPPDDPPSPPPLATTATMPAATSARAAAATSHRRRGRPARRLAGVGSWPWRAGGRRGRELGLGYGRGGRRGLRRRGSGRRDIDRLACGRGQLARARLALGRLLGQSGSDHLVQRGGHLRPCVRQARWRLGEVSEHLRHVSLALEGRLAGDHLIEHATERVYVRSGSDLAAHDLLGRGVVGRAQPLAGARQHPGHGPDRLDQPEVGQVGVVPGGPALEQDVGRLDVAVHKSTLCAASSASAT